MPTAQARPRKPTTRTFRPTTERLEERLVLSTLPPGFNESPFTTGLNRPTTMEFAPDGRLFIAEQDGALRVVKEGNLLETPFLVVDVDGAGERGLIGLTFDPEFETNPYVYVHYTTAAEPAFNRVSRFLASGDVAVPGSEEVILELEPLTAATNHNGGAIHFGPDGMLYVAVGDNAVPERAQSLGSRFGKILRIHPDGSIPGDNPFVHATTGANQSIWALGLRNPYTFAFQSGTGRMFINDVGSARFEEINVGTRGANYGWPETEGPTDDPRFQGPFFAYPHGQGEMMGCAIVGGAFDDPANSQLPPELAGGYFFADFCGGWIWRLDPNSAEVSVFATDLPFGTVDLRFGPDGALYYLSRGSNAVGRIQNDHPPAPPTDNEAFLQRLYRDVLSRDAEPEGLSFWTDRLTSGASRRVDVVAAFVHSLERRSRFVTDLYERYLQRSPDPNGLSFWLGLMEEGMTREEVSAGILGSQEYFHRAGESPEQFVSNLFLDVLGRVANPEEVAYWSDAVGSTSQTAVAQAIVTSLEAGLGQITFWYQTRLERSPSESDQALWTSLLIDRISQADIEFFILATPEYTERA